MSEIRKVQNGKLSLREIYISDPTDSIKLDLWEDNVDKGEVGKTYVFSNLRVKKNMQTGEVYVNTAKSDKFIIEETEPFDTQLAIAIDVDQLRQAKEKGEIVGIKKCNIK